MTDSENRRREWAEFRFRVIAPLVCGEYTPQELSIIRRGILSKAHETPDGEMWQVSERTLRQWVANHKSAGLGGLHDGKRKKGEQFTAIDPHALEIAKMLREELRSRSVKQILRHMAVSFGIDVSKISRTTLNKYLNQLGARKEKDYSDQGAYQPFQKSKINMVWQSDCSDGIWLPDPTGQRQVKKTVLITFIDDASRLCTHGEFFWQAQLPELFDCFRKAVTKRGVVQKLYTDHGNIFKSKQWRSVCADLGIQQLFSEKGHPPGRGKIEKHYRTIQEGFYKEAQLSGIQTLAELNEFFWSWLQECYHKELHSTLKETPLARWQREEDAIKRVDPEKLRNALVMRYKRQVDFKTSLISLEGRKYLASKQLGGQRVQIRRRFDCFDEVEVWNLGGEYVETAKEYVTPEDIDYSKRPDRQAERPKGYVLESSKTYRLAMVARLRNSKPEQKQDDLLAETEFKSLLENKLSKQFDEIEDKQIRDFYFMHCPLRRSFVESVLERCIAEKGISMHIKLYLRRIEETQLKLR